jgi:hypothetical protein
MARNCQLFANCCIDIPPWYQAPPWAGFENSEAQTAFQGCLKNVKGSGRDNIRMFKHSEECGGFGERLSILRNRAEIPECNFEPSEGSIRIPGKLKISEKSRGS